MARRTLNKLSATQSAKITKPGRHSDGGGLYLFIDPHGRRRWIFMYTRDGKRTELGLGGGRDLSLANARAEAAKLREILATGGDPKTERAKDERIPTFGECADAYVEAMKPSWRNAKHAAQWTMTLTKYAKPMRGKPVNAIGTQDVLDVLQALWKRTPETAERLRGRIENVLDAAKAKGHRSGENPARWRGHLDQLLPKRQRLSRGHHAALPYDAMPDFMADLRVRSAVAARALEFTILTAARSGEVLGAQWDEIDTEKKVWAIPAERMKAGREHRVPLSPRAMEIVAAMSKLGTEGYLFPGPKPKKPLSSMAMAMLLRRMKAEITVHGFRSTFRDWASETTGFPHEVCEMALAHTIGNKAEAAYRRGDLFDKRRKLMEAWAGYCAKKAGAKVVPLHPARQAA
ncbi:integrase arm-type DNA-binding domain-containing protein [Sphingosinicella sp. LHD-64]|uniref:tyrosine-type recombinase/integrase n=1 Tax=Sphingosinicella sp. LHD-64 TaxID=3072139 RepID=UPI00280D2195|nr:integrase arm-type DNA-binding domain-containing protein [Sphingosinicella sp. LHD-64]MDQ8756922.1 integrase arm-type DNA-binding domain-containing protein [Sphingosinicella sp. LHD-64]